jgi:hypothetical protein
MSNFWQNILLIAVTFLGSYFFGWWGLCGIAGVFFMLGFVQRFSKKKGTEST